MLRAMTFVLAMLAGTSSWANVLVDDDQERVANFLKRHLRLLRTLARLQAQLGHPQQGSVC
jgi:hypothetical protein